MAHSDPGSEAVDSRSFESFDDAAAALTEDLEIEEGAEPDDEDLDDEPVEGNPDEEEGVENPDDQEDEPEDEPETAIDAPASLTAEEKEAFGQLPAEAQLAMKSFATRRDQEVQQGLEKARSAQRQATAEAAEKAAAAKKTAAESIYALANAYKPQMPDPAHFQDLHQYNQAKFQYDQAIAQHNEVVQQATNQFEAATAEAEEVDKQFIAERDKGLMEIPEVANSETRQKYLDDVFSVAEELGFEKDFLAQNGDVRDIKAMGTAAGWKAKAAKWDALQSQKMKGVRAGKRPAKSRAAQPRGSGGVKRAEKAFSSNPSRATAAALIATQLED